MSFKALKHCHHWNRSKRSPAKLCPDLIADHEGVGVLLEGGHRPHVAHPLLYRLVQRNGLVGSRDQNHHLHTHHHFSRCCHHHHHHHHHHHLPGVHNSANAHSESLLGDKVNVATKEPDTKLRLKEYVTADSVNI